MSLQMSRRPKPSLIASLLAVLCLGAGGGALLYAAYGPSQSKPAAQPVTVKDSDGNIVTNAHVADGAKKISVQFWNGKTYPATLVGSDPSSDIAVVHVSAPDSQLFPLTVGDSSKLEVGDGVVAIG